MKYKLLLIVFLLLFIVSSSFSQKVGVVLSGGGAKGLAHIGVLKAFEENNIPIDYITGTSMGGLLGGMYASGYSPYDLEYIVQSLDFQSWVSGSFDSEYSYYFKKKSENASVVSLGLEIDSGFQARFRSNLVNDIPLNFALLQLAAQATANSDGNFDSLMIPFRCMAADVFSQQQVIMKNGSLSDAMRATMTVPYVYRPIRINDRYLFDGGLYNNFPVDVMTNEFHPDIIIGVNVSSKIYKQYPFDTDDELVSRLINYLLLAKTDSTTVSQTGIYIQPDVGDYSVLEFRYATQLIQAGYDAAMAKMPLIKEKIAREQSVAEKRKMRNAFLFRRPPLQFDEIRVDGVNSRQRVYVRRTFNPSGEKLTLAEVKPAYYKLVANDNFRTVYPRIMKKEFGQDYDFELYVKNDRSFRAELGGNISSRPINSVFVGFQYNYLTKYAATFSGDFYLGRFYEAVQMKARLDFPFRLPVYLESEFTYNHWDYFKSSQIFLEDLALTFIDQTDRNLVFTAGVPMKGNGKFMIQVGGFNIRDRFSQNNVYFIGDTLDRSIFNSFKYAAAYESNRLNAKQFATAGKKYGANIQYYTGIERYVPGSQSLVPFHRQARKWIKSSVQYEAYQLVSKRYTLGWEFQAVYSSQPLFSSYQSTILMSPSFNPLLDSKTLFLVNYRGFFYAAAGIKNIFTLSRNVHLRLEAYVFQPYEKVIDDNQKAKFAEAFKHTYLAAGSSLVYRSPLGPVSFTFNYYDDPKKELGVLFNVGYLLFNKRPIE